MGFGFRLVKLLRFWKLQPEIGLKIEFNHQGIRFDIQNMTSLSFHTSPASGSYFGEDSNPQGGLDQILRETHSSLVFLICWES